MISKTTKHTAPIKALQFNPLKPQILATAGAKGEIFVYDVNDISNPFRLGSPAARPEDLDCIAWNRKVPHILATGGTGGFVSIWDLKTKKTSLTLNNNRKPVSAIAWDPNNSTKLLAATPEDGEPRIFLWNLRNSNAPERILQGHLSGVLSLSWCEQDSDLLMSSGKDAKTIVWNPQSGEKLGELPEVTNWTFLTRFHPHNPNLSATASFEGKIAIQTLQNTNPDTSNDAALSSMDDTDFFSNVQTQPQTASFSLSKAPKWFERPIGASFGFGGKLIVFKGSKDSRKSKIEILPFSVDSDLSTASQKFEDAMNAGDVKKICDEHRKEAQTEEEKADWLVMGTLVAEDQRKQIVEYLSFSMEESLGEDEHGESQEKENEEEKEEKKAANDEPAREDAAKSRLSNFFADSGDGDDEFPSPFDTGSGSAQPGTPFFLIDAHASPVEQKITRALIQGNFEQATVACLKEKLFADAFMIANCGPKELVEKVQAAYVSHMGGDPSYLRLVGSVIGKDLRDVVDNADLSNWKEIIMMICTYATPEKFPDLCEALGDRIFISGFRKDASFCYLVSSKLEKVVSIWITELEEEEQEGVKVPNEDSTFSVHARSLQHFIEKVTVFRHVTKFEDSEKNLSSGWRLAALYDKYVEYADIVAAHGLLSVAQKYLDLLPAAYPAAELSRSRVQQATRSSAPKVAGLQTASVRTSSRAAPTGYQPAQPAGASTTANPYQPSQPQFRTFTPPSASPYQQVAPTGPYAPPSQFGSAGNIPLTGGPPPPPPLGGSLMAGPPTGGPRPPSTTNPATTKKDFGAWNDVPMVTKAAPARRSTPTTTTTTTTIAPGTSAPGLSNFSMPPSIMSPYQSTTATPPPPPPPPKGPAPARMTSPPQTVQAPPRPSSAANAYAPPPPPQVQPPAASGPPMPRVSSPYNPPPTSTPPTNRYAPAPTVQAPVSQPSMSGQAMGGPPPTSSSGYAAAPSPGTTTRSPYNPSPYAPPSQSQHPAAPPPPGMSASSTASAPPMARPQIEGPPRSGPPASRGSLAAPPPHAAPAAPPKGTGQIPPEAKRMVDTFSREIRRVAGLAPQQFANIVADSEKRLNILFEHLKKGDLVKPDTISELSQVAEALERKDYGTATSLQVKIQTSKTEECGNWMVCFSIVPSCESSLLTRRCTGRCEAAHLDE